MYPHQHQLGGGTTGNHIRRPTVLTLTSWLDPVRLADAQRCQCAVQQRLRQESSNARMTVLRRQLCGRDSRAPTGAVRQQTRLAALGHQHGHRGLFASHRCPVQWAVAQRVLKSGDCQLGGARRHALYRCRIWLANLSRNVAHDAQAWSAGSSSADFNQNCRRCRVSQAASDAAPQKKTGSTLMGHYKCPPAR